MQSEVIERAVGRVAQLVDMVRENFGRLPEYERAVLPSGSIQFVFGDDAGANAAVTLAADGVSLRRGLVDRPDAWLRCDADRFAGSAGELLLNERNLAEAIATGEFAVRGDVELLGAFGQLRFAPPPKLVRNFEIAEAWAKDHPVDSVMRIEGATREDVGIARSSSRPAVFVEAWRWPEERLSFEILERFTKDFLTTKDGARSSIGEFAARIRGGDPFVYSGGGPTPAALREYLKEPPLFASGDFLGVCMLWMGAAADEFSSLLHRDPSDNLLCHLLGHKRVLLFSPDQADLLYPSAVWSSYQNCLVNPERPNLERFPLVQKARAFELTLGPGDLLYIPCGWFHHVIALDSVMSISFALAGAYGSEYASLR